MSQPNDILLYDGDCLLCSKWMQFFSKRLKSPIRIEELDNFPDRLDVDSVQLFRKGQPFTHSAAVIRCLLYMGWHWKILYPFAWLVPSRCVMPCIEGWPNAVILLRLEYFFCDDSGLLTLLEGIQFPN